MLLYRFHLQWEEQLQLQMGKWVCCCDDHKKRRGNVDPISASTVRPSQSPAISTHIPRNGIHPFPSGGRENMKRSWLRRQRWAVNGRGRDGCTSFLLLVFPLNYPRDGKREPEEERGREGSKSIFSRLEVQNSSGPHLVASGRRHFDAALCLWLWTDGEERKGPIFR